MPIPIHRTTFLDLLPLRAILRNYNSTKSTTKSSNDFTTNILVGLLNGNRRSLSSAITLLESTTPAHRTDGQFLLDSVMKYRREIEKTTGKYSFRIGISGPPGAGKSTFIEAFGNRLTKSVPWDKPDTDFDQLNNRIAVLAVDPSSKASGGSLLADKTRMTQLSHNPNAYIRPSPSGGCLGGVARTTNELVWLCEAAGYDTVVIETVGVGQSEFAAAEMVDFFVLIIPPAGGDQLQGIKKGIIEVADLIIVNKADGDLLPAARNIATEYSLALKYSHSRRKNWQPKVILVSSLHGTGLSEFWSSACAFYRQRLETNELLRVRQEQLKSWMWNFIREGVLNEFKRSELVTSQRAEIERMVLQGELTPGIAAEKLINLFLTKR